MILPIEIREMTWKYAAIEEFDWADETQHDDE